MSFLSDIFTAQKRVWQQEREIAHLREELHKLRAQNDSMRQGMRRCVTCEYRIDFKQRQDSGLDTEALSVTLEKTPESQN